MTSILFRFVRICSSLFKCTYVKNQNLFLNFLFCLFNVHQILNISKKKMIVIGNVFPILQTVKDLVRSLSKIHRFRTSFDSQHVKGSQTLVKSAWEHFYHIFHLSDGKWLKNILKTILTFLFHFWNIQKMLNIFKKRKIVIANVYPKLQNIKDHTLTSAVFKATRKTERSQERHLKTFSTF